MFQGTFIGVSRVYKRSSEGVSRKFKMNFKEGCIKNASSVFQEMKCCFTIIAYMQSSKGSS